jgi:RHS repeat-associated protein
MQMARRVFTGSEEPGYGFNGKEMDNEVSGNGNQYDYGFRIYNPRIARFLSVDPLTSSYPMLTPYQFASNTPIAAIDIDGLEAYIVTETLNKKEKVARISVTRYEDVSGVAQDNRLVNNLTGATIPYKEVLIFTKDANGDFVGQPRYDDELSAKQKIVKKFGRQEEKGSHNYPGTGSNQFSTKKNHGVKGTYKSSIGVFDFEGHGTSSKSELTIESFRHKIHVSFLPLEDNEVVYRVDIVFSSEDLKDELYGEAKSHYEKMFPDAVINPMVDKERLEKGLGTKLEKGGGDNESGIGVRLHKVK